MYIGSWKMSNIKVYTEMYRDGRIYLVSIGSTCLNARSSMFANLINPTKILGEI